MKLGPVQRRRRNATTACWGFAIIATMLALLWFFVDVAPAARRSGALCAAAMATLGAACAIGCVRRSATRGRWAMVLVVYLNGVIVWGSALSHTTLGMTCITLLTCALVAAAAVRLWLFVPEIDAPGRCIGCGYNLTGNTSGRCPECGEPIRSGPQVTQAERSEGGDNPGTDAR